jgi:hypothetical protein
LSISLAFFVLVLNTLTAINEGKGVHNVSPKIGQNAQKHYYNIDPRSANSGSVISRSWRRRGRRKIGGGRKRPRRRATPT